MAGKDFATMVWLVPSSASYACFQSLISALARRYDGPSFEPHLTLGRIKGHSLPDTMRPTGPIVLEPLGIFTSELFTKTLFVRFASTRALGSLRLSLGLEPGEYDPHLSLLYCKLAPGEGGQLAASLQLPTSKVHFDQLWLVRCPDPTSNRAEVEEWERLAARPLSGE